MSQLSLFDAMRAPAIIRPVQPHGRVLHGRALHTFALPHRHLVWDRCRIEVHPSRDGLWMWGVSYNTSLGASGYKVGEKWGQFAVSAEDALHYAIEELRGRLGRAHHYNKAAEKLAAKILTWAESLTLEASHA